MQKIGSLGINKHPKMNLRRLIVSLCTRRKAGATEEEWKDVRFSFSQFGEDLLLEHLLPPKGFYVDVGAPTIRSPFPTAGS